MTYRLALLLSVLPAVGMTQARDLATDQKILAELKGVRAALEKLEAGQKTLAALTRIQIDEGRIAHLEAQRLQLSAKEQELKKEVDRAAMTLRGVESGSATGPVQTATGRGESISSVDLGPLRARHSQAAQNAEETTRARQSIEQSIAVLRNRIAVMEKYLEGATR